MEQAFYSLVEGETKYEVFYDDDEIHELFRGTAMDFDNEEQKEAYFNKFRREELSAYGVKSRTRCSCCNEWKVKESLWGIHAKDCEQAIEYFKECF